MVHFLNKLASLVSFMCRLALSTCCKATSRNWTGKCFVKICTNVPFLLRVFERLFGEVLLKRFKAMFFSSVCFLSTPVCDSDSPNKCQEDVSLKPKQRVQASTR